MQKEHIDYDSIEDEPNQSPNIPQVIHYVKILDEDEDHELIARGFVDVYACNLCNLELEVASDIENHFQSCPVYNKRKQLVENTSTQMPLRNTTQNNSTSTKHTCKYNALDFGSFTERNEHQPCSPTTNQTTVFPYSWTLPINTTRTHSLSTSSENEDDNVCAYELEIELPADTERHKEICKFYMENQLSLENNIQLSMGNSSNVSPELPTTMQEPEIEINEYAYQLSTQTCSALPVVPTNETVDPQLNFHNNSAIEHLQLENNANQQSQTNFCNYFGLQNKANQKHSTSPIDSASKLKHIIQTSRRISQIPLASPLGSLLLKHADWKISDEERREYLNNIDQNCLAPDINLGVPEFMTQGEDTTKYRVTYTKGKKKRRRRKRK